MPSYYVYIPGSSLDEKLVVYARRQFWVTGLIGFFKTAFRQGLMAATYPYLGYVATQRNQGYDGDSFYYFKNLDARLLFEKLESLYKKQA